MYGRVLLGRRRSLQRVRVVSPAAAEAHKALTEQIAQLRADARALDRLLVKFDTLEDRLVLQKMSERFEDRAGLLEAARDTIGGRL